VARRITVNCVPMSLYSDAWTYVFIRLSKGFGADAHGQNSTKAASKFRFEHLQSASDAVPKRRGS
jgi:hypothetical protein